MIRFAIIADDLSGGMITGVQFTAAGLRPTVVAAGHVPVSGLERLGDTVPIWDTASRADDPRTAYEKVRTAVRTVSALAPAFYYKQADSQLRGNLGAELRALLDESQMPGVLCCFANPDINRVTVGGYHLVDGRPVHVGPAGADTVTPVTRSDVPALLEQQMGRPVAQLDWDLVHRGGEPLIRVMQAALATAAPGADRAAILVADALSEADLLTLARAAHTVGLQAACGSYGLARAFGRALSDLAPAPSRPFPGGVLVLAGSTTEIVAEQIRHLAARPDTVILSLSPDAALAGPALGSLVAEAAAELETGRHVAVVSEGTPSAVQTALAIGNRMGISPTEVSRRIAGALGEAASQVLAAAPGLVRGIIATGGDTACAVYQRLGEALELVEQPIPGAATGLLRPSGTPFIAKSGACGGPEALYTLIHSLRHYAQ